MTISTETNLAVYQGNGATTVFAFPFYVLEEGDLEIQLQAAESGTVTHTYVSGEYTLSGIGDPAGGSVTILGTPITSDYKLTIERVLPYTQPLDLVNETGFYPDEVEKQFDRDVMQTQQLKRLIDAAITVPKGETGFTLPAASTRASKYLAFDAGGDLVTVVGTSSDPAVTANMLRVTSRAALKALNVTLYALAFLDHVSGGVFKLRQGAMPTDVQEGIYIASDTATYYWERDWDGIHGKPEWFGAVTNSSSGGVPAANLTAIAACVTLCPVTLLEKADYFISNVWKFTEAVSRKTIRGVAGAIDTQGDATRVVLTGANAATAKVLQVGPDSMPATYPSNVPYELHFHDIVFMRNAAVTPGATVFDGVRGVSVQGALGCTFHNIKSVDSAIGFYITGAVNCHFDSKCQSHRATAGTSPTNDYTVGWMLGGVAANFGFAGANASVYLANPIATVSTSVSFIDTFGLYAFGYIADTFITDLETTSFNKGGLVDGQSITTAGAQANFTLNNPRFDAFGSNGLEINNLNSTANVDVSNPYFGPLSTGDFGLRIYNTNNGPVKVRGGVVAAYYTNPAGFIGLALDTTQGVMVDGLALIDCDKPVVVSNSSGYDIKPHINNPNHTGADVAVAFVNTNARGRCDPIVRGKAAAFTVGVSYAGTASNNTETGLSAINPGCLTASSANNKIFYNGSTTIGTTPFGTGNLYLGSVT